MTAPARPLIGVLDFGLCPPGVGHAEAVRAIIERAAHADRLGYSCYWLGEHYEATVSYTNPAALVPVIAGMTENLRVGSAAHLLAVHHPARLAADYALYESLFPGRIDCGVGSGRPGPVPPDLVIAPERPYAEKFEVLARRLHDPAEASPHRLPPLGPRPRLWSMGAGGYGLDLAVKFGTAYSHARWLAPPGGNERFRRTLGNWQDAAPAAPVVNLSVAGICAPSHQEAERLAAACPLPVQPDIVGEPARCGDWLRSVSETLEIEEIVFLDLALEAEHRVRTLELLATELL